MPGGVNSPVRAWKSVGGSPIFIEKGKGSKITDANGRSYIDYVMSWGPLILGHAQEDVIGALSKTARYGTSFGAPNKLEIELAKRIVNAVPSIDKIRFVNSGTEAIMSAIRLARAYTKRDKIIKFIGAYHGHADFLLAKSGSGIITLGIPDSAGVPNEVTKTTILAPYNNIRAIKKIFDKFRKEVAAVIVEPVAGNMGVVPPQKSFLETLLDLTSRNKSLLIFDEVITGFRVGYKGAQGLYGIKPDLTCLGKIIGGGLPVGAYGGRDEIMQMVAPLGPVYQAGTLSGNPLAMAAGITTLDRLKNPDTYKNLEDLSSALENGFKEAAEKNNVKVVINRIGSMMTLFFNDKPVVDYETAKNSNTGFYRKFFHSMIEKNIYLPPSQFEAFFVSLAHTKKDIEKTISIAEKIFSSLS